MMHFKEPNRSGGYDPYDLPPSSRPRRYRRDWGMFWLGVLVGMLAMIVLDLSLGSLHAQSYTQNAKRNAYAIDGDTIVVDGVHVRLSGIDAPELNQTCDNEAVGQMAKERMQQLLNMGAIACQPEKTDKYGRTIATCFVAGHDLGRIMVGEGLAFAYRRYSTKYVQDESRGPVHAYHCLNPETFRHSQSTGGPHAR